MSNLEDGKTEKVAAIIRSTHTQRINRLLVVGCGKGIEAAILAQQLGAEVTGIDLKDEFNATADRYAELKIGDATRLEFADGSFDYIFSYHALEHIEDPKQALREMHRVLKHDGGFWIGTPNRSRIVGYIGGKDTLLREKVRWNIADWRTRLAGKFRNEFGAHAGFTSSELSGLLADVFSTVTEATDRYFSTIYSNHPTFIRAIRSSGLSRIIYPSVYFLGKK